MPYTHLSAIERGQVQAMIREGHSQAQIARALGRNRSTISRELARNHASYDAQSAQKRYSSRREECRRGRSLDYPPLRRYVLDGMAQGWSPEQVSGRLWLDYPGVPRMRVSVETIYRFIYQDEKWGALMRPYLRRRKPRRQRRGGPRPTRPVIPNRVSIEHRPACVNELARYGDWEGDTILGRNQKGAIVTLVERKSMLTKAALLQTKQADPVAGAITQLLAPLPPQWRHTLTLDNGTEFYHHEKIHQAIGIDIYFSHTYAACERGRNENTNGLIRQYLPKSSDFTVITPQLLQRIIDELNNRPRKKLGYRTPLEVFQGNNVALTV